MSFKFEMKGFDKIEKMLDKMVTDLEPAGFAQWVNKIEKTAKQICKDPDCKRIKFKPKTGKTEISMEVTDKEALECLKKAIQQYKNSMSLGIKGIFDYLVKTEFPKLEKQLDKESST